VAVAVVVAVAVGRGVAVSVARGLAVGVALGGTGVSVSGVAGGVAPGSHPQRETARSSRIPSRSHRLGRLGRLALFRPGLSFRQFNGVRWEIMAPLWQVFAGASTWPRHRKGRGRRGAAGVCVGHGLGRGGPQGAAAAAATG